MTRCITRITLTLAVLPLGTAWSQVDLDRFGGMTARSIGPAGMSGRVAAIDVVVSDPNIIYVGSATGGVWKSVDGGITWEPIFDDQPSSSIGAIAIYQPNPDIVWVGTGEGNPRNSAGVGNGIYKSLDGGRTWSHLGLERSERIHRVVLDPTDADIAYVGAMGPTWSDGDQRGVYKTTDGGETWERILWVNQRTGVADLVMDPGNPNKLLAAMWEHRREPWFFTSGGPGSGLYVTYDGGEQWRRYTSTDGMPEGELGRIGIAIAPGNPEVVYALVEATKSALLRSDDGGHHWTTISDERGIAPRPFYYADIRVDPQNENRLYSIHGRATVSEDAGRTFRTIVPSSVIHGDVHELWIHPSDGRMLLMGNDGGVGISYDRGDNWRFVENLPLAQFYHLNVDMSTPFNVYGGLQDNGSWFGPSALWRRGGIRNYYWTRVSGGDGFATMTNFAHPRYGYSMSQQGNLRRFDRRTGELKDIQPVHPDGIPLRFSWNAALNVDPIDSSTVYFGSQFVHRTTDHGDTWTIISPDLTTSDPAKQRADESGGLTRDATGAENHTTIMTIAPSPVAHDVIWVGTDDGNVQVTRDEGEHWENVVRNIPDVPANTWVPHIEPSKFDSATAFVVLDDHRRGNWTTYVYKTTDFGRSWRSLATPNITGFAHVIEQDQVERDLLFLGTEFGMYVSLDGGQSWEQWAHGLPTAPYRALIVHPRDHDLAIGTHGRGVYILDDIRPLRAVAANPSILGRPLHLFPPPPAYQHPIPDAIGYRSTGHAMFMGENRPFGALLSYWIGDGDRTDSVEVSITDASGEVVREVALEAAPGIGRWTWNLRRDGIEAPTRSGTTTRQGPVVVPGSFTVRMVAGTDTATTEVVVHPDPRRPFRMADARHKHSALLAVATQYEQAAEAVARLRDISEALEVLVETNAEMPTDLRAAADSVATSLDVAVAQFVPMNSGQGIFSNDDAVVSMIDDAWFALSSSWDAPTEADEYRTQRAGRALSTALGDVDRLLEEAVNPLAARFDRAGVRLRIP